MKLGVQTCFFGGNNIFKRNGRGNRVVQGMPLGYDMDLTKQQPADGELGSKDCLSVESCVGKKWFGSVPLPFSAVGWG